MYLYNCPKPKLRQSYDRNRSRRLNSTKLITNKISKQNNLSQKVKKLTKKNKLFLREIGLKLK